MSAFVTRDSVYCYIVRWTIDKLEKLLCSRIFKIVTVVNIFSNNFSIIEVHSTVYDNVPCDRRDNISFPFMEGTKVFIKISYIMNSKG